MAAASRCSRRFQAAAASSLESVGYIALRRLEAGRAIVHACSGSSLESGGEPLVALASQALDLIRILYDDFRNGRDEL